MRLMEHFFLSHSLQLAGAFIASTALLRGISLITGNVKHFKCIPRLDVISFNPSKILQNKSIMPIYDK